MKESEYFQSEEFKNSYIESVKRETWEKDLPMIYMDDSGRIIKEYKNGEIEIVKDQK